MDILKKLQEKILYFDGSTGTMLQSMGLEQGVLPETWNVTHKDNMVDMYKRYFISGSDVVNTNTFGANHFKFNKTTEFSLEEIIINAVENVKTAIKETDYLGRERYIALDLGPLGKILEPLGDLSFEDAVSAFKKTIEIALPLGIDVINIETMNDSLETKAAVIAAKECCSLPVFVSNVYDESHRLMTGADIKAMVATLEGLSVDAIGVNCALGPKQILPIIEEFLKYSSLPIIATPNAGLPRFENGKTVFDVEPQEFAEDVKKMILMGARIVGGCCGTTPEHIKSLVDATKDIVPLPVQKKNFTVVSSYNHSVILGDKPILIGERINPTGKPKFKQALKNNDIAYIVNEGISQQEKGVQILDVNVGLPEIDEPLMLCKAINELQRVSDLPLQIDTSDFVAMEKAMRIYNGKPLVNSVNGKKSSMDAIFPLVKKYGGVVIALTLDENGIPGTAQGRFEIAKRIADEAKNYGIDKKDIVVDPLALTISSDKNSALITLESVRLIKEKLGVKTSLGVSNISFGLPQREYITSTFFTMALENGLDAAIINPYSFDMMKSYYAFLALKGLDDNCAEYINFAQNNTVVQTQVKACANDALALEDNEPLKQAVIKGLKDDAGAICEKMLQNTAPLEIINSQIIPALDVVGKGFENKTVFLPQLLMSAEAAKSAFDKVKEVLKSNESGNEQKNTVVIATVKGDIHDIGKNIVKVMLENYGFNVIDLGKDVSPDEICHCAIKSNATLVGLSALMTTTVVSMEDTIKLLNEKLPDCKIMVGGAVLNDEYAQMIKADYYAKDAMGAVRIAEKHFKEQ